MIAAPRSDLADPAAQPGGRSPRPKPPSMDWLSTTTASHTSPAQTV